MGNKDANGSFFWIEEPNEQTPIPMKHKRKIKSKTEFIGWGSKSLIDFLQSIGKDTDQELSERQVTAIILEYVHTLNLFHPIKKKKVLCDDRLRSLFGKKSVPRIKIQDLLKSHFADNESSEDDHLYSSDEYEESNISFKKQKVFDSEKKAPSQKKKERVSSFAAIIPENMKLLYLKKSLVQELVKNPESFEEKILGSYIRVKNDPNDYTQKNSHQLLPVTGVKKEHGNSNVNEVLLEVPFMVKDIPISLLSDFDFSKEECEDLCQKVKDGLLKRPTVVEFEQKAKMLHEDITKHWLPRELAYLQNLIDRANEKGWRKAVTLHEYIDRRKLLQTPSEQSKLLTQVPKVTPDALDPMELQQDIQEISSPDVAEQPIDPVIAKEGNQEPMENGGNKVISVTNTAENVTSFEWVETEKISNIENPDNKTALVDSNNARDVIELSDDEDNNNKTHEQQVDVHDFSRPQWFYLDPQGKIQGPVSKYELKCWSDAGYFLPDFKVWKDGQPPESAVLLTEMLSGS